MNERKPSSPMTASLRQRAEKLFRETLDQSQDHLDGLSPETLRSALHELRVHQIELEMQNEELLRVQGDLDGSRVRYFDLYDLAPVGYCTLSEHGLILEANLTAATLLGAARGTLVTKSFSSFIAKEEQDVYYLHLKRVLGTGEPQSFDLRMAKSDGSAFWGHVEACAAKDEAGSPVCRVTLIDITGRKRTEEVMAFLARTGSATKDEPFFNALARFLARSLGVDFICIDRLEGEGLNARTLAVWCDGHFEDNVTYALKDTPCGDVVGKEVCCFPAAVCQAFPRDQVLRDLRAESYIGVTLWSHDGKPIGLIAAIGRGPLADRPLAEATLKLVAERASGELERMDREQALRESEAQVRAITDSARDAIIMMDSRGSITYWNPASETIFGYGREEAVGKDLHALLVPEHYLQGFRAAFPEFQRTGRGNAVGKTVEMSARRKDGQEIAVSLSLSAVLLNGEWCSVGIVRDISARKQAEEDLLALNRHLENKNTLAEDLARKAEAATLAKSEFLAVMSHELRTPLNGVLGFAELLSDTPLSDEQNLFVQTIASSGEHLLSLVNDVLDFSSIEKGVLEIKRELFATADLLGSSAVDARKAAADKGLKFCCETAPGVPGQIFGDERRIRQILINLLINAVKFTERGSVVLHVARSSGKGPPFLDFSVTDTGIGISSETIGRLFQPFVQAETTLHRQFEGTGLGLAISKRIAEAMGGSIAVESAPGKGSTFRFRLPLEPAPSPGGSRARPGRPSDATPALHPGALVLVVEDNSDSRTLTGIMLRNLGCRAEFSADGAEAVKAFAPGKFAAILMDVSMPVMDGIEATKKIREIEAAARSGNVPILAMTANVMSGDRERCQASGMDGFLSKPFKLQDLSDKLAPFLRG
ncbi:MAG: PAS domain S-box protein [Verrucomicrobiota bacterium]